MRALQSNRIEVVHLCASQMVKCKLDVQRFSPLCCRPTIVVAFTVLCKNIFLSKEILEHMLYYLHQICKGNMVVYHSKTKKKDKSPTKYRECSNTLFEKCSNTSPVQTWPSPLVCPCSALFRPRRSPQAVSTPKLYRILLFLKCVMSLSLSSCNVFVFVFV